MTEYICPCVTSSVIWKWACLGAGNDQLLSLWWWCGDLPGLQGGTLCLRPPEAVHYLPVN